MDVPSAPSALLGATSPEPLVVGRERECAQIDELLGRARRGRSASLVLRGEAGIGKTALLGRAVAGADGMTVVRALGVESEAELEFSALLDLARPLLEYLPELPAAQADALRIALGLGSGAVPERFAVGAATLGLLAAAAEANPLLVVVDDAHWLDRATADALLFAVRRLHADRVAALFGVRETDPRRFEAPGLDSLDLEGLSLEHASTLLARTSGLAIPGAVAERLYEATRGNPLALQELPRLLSAAQLTGREPLTEPLPTTEGLERAFGRRAQALPEESRRALLVAAVSPSPEAETILLALAAAGLTAEAIELAEDAGLVQLDAGRIAFRHPLVRSAVFHSAAPSERRAAHRALAEASPAGDRRAWHLAGAALGFDAEAAAALEETATLAAKRGGFASAAAALERAASLTLDADARLRRLGAAARCAWEAGGWEQARQLLEEPLAATERPIARAEALRLQGRIEFQAARPVRAGELLLEAAELVAEVDPRLAVESCMDACVTQIGVGDADALLAAAERAGVLAAATGDERLGLDASLARGFALTYAGRPRDGAPLLEHAVASVGPAPVRVLGLSGTLGSIALDFLERPHEALAHVNAAVDETRAQGAAGLLTFLVYRQGYLAVRCGRLGDAYSSASESLRLAEEIGLPMARAQSLLALAMVAARRGLEAEYDRLVAEALPLVEHSGLRMYHLTLVAARGQLELALGRHDTAATHLEAAARGLRELGIHLPGLVPHADLVEAHARAARTDEAQATLDALAHTPEASTRIGRAAELRGRGLLDADTFDAAFEEALALGRELGDGWSLARTQLCFGERLRRAGRRVEAREQLRPAEKTFAELGCEVWAERARMELRASGERRRRHVSWEEELTPQELQIALHVARGLTNREVGSSLFLSHKTVEFHLGRVYRKLNMHSRAELIRRFAAATPDPAPPGASPS